MKKFTFSKGRNEYYSDRVYKGGADTGGKGNTREKRQQVKKYRTLIVGITARERRGWITK